MQTESPHHSGHNTAPPRALSPHSTGVTAASRAPKPTNTGRGPTGPKQPRNSRRGSSPAAQGWGHAPRGTQTHRRQRAAEHNGPLHGQHRPAPSPAPPWPPHNFPAPHGSFQARSITAPTSTAARRVRARSRHSPTSAPAAGTAKSPAQSTEPAPPPPGTPHPAQQTPISSGAPFSNQVVAVSGTNLLFPHPPTPSC